MGDYLGFGKATKKEDQFLKNNHFDLILTSCLQVVRVLHARQIADKIKFFPFFFDTSVCYDMKFDRDIDVMASFAHELRLYPKRHEVLAALKTMPINSFLRSKQLFKHYIEIINNSKIFVNANAISRNASFKYHEAMACGALFITDKPDELNFLGYEDNEHLVLYNAMEDMKEKILYFLAHEKEREDIKKAGMRFARKNFSNKTGARQLIDLIEKEL